MGHDIYAYGRDEKAAYLRRGAFSEPRDTLYKLLGAQEHDAGVSGDGGAESYSQEALEEALETAKIQHQDEPDLIEFLEDCVKAGEYGVVIEFG